jgi:hypothetical protein
MAGWRVARPVVVVRSKHRIGLRRGRAAVGQATADGGLHDPRQKEREHDAEGETRSGGQAGGKAADRGKAHGSVLFSDAADVWTMRTGSTVITPM